MEPPWTLTSQALGYPEASQLSSEFGAFVVTVPYDFPPSLHLPLPHHLPHCLPELLCQFNHSLFFLFYGYYVLIVRKGLNIVFLISYPAVVQSWHIAVLIPTGQAGCWLSRRENSARGHLLASRVKDSGLGQRSVNWPHLPGSALT